MKKIIFFLTVIIILTNFIIIVDAQDDWSVNINSPDEVISEDNWEVNIEPPITPTSTFNNNTGNVNSSDYWDDLDAPNSTQMNGDGGILSIMESWLKTWADAFYVPLGSEGNNSFNESYANGKYILINGTTPSLVVNNSLTVASNINTTKQGMNNVYIERSKFSKVVFWSGTAFTDVTREASMTRGTVFTLLADNADYLYVGNNDNFTEIYFDLNTLGVGNTLTFDYSQGGSSWNTLVVNDGTAGFTADGTMTFAVPNDWARDTVNVTTAYYVRIGSSTSSSTDATAFSVVPDNNSLIGIYGNANDVNPVLGVTRDGNSYIDSVGNPVTFLSSITSSTITSSSYVISSQTTTTNLVPGIWTSEASAASTTVPVRVSPSVKWTARVWNGTGSALENFNAYLYAENGTSPNATLQFVYDYNGYQNKSVMNISGNGNVLINGNLTINGNYISNGSAQFSFEDLNATGSVGSGYIPYIGATENISLNNKYINTTGEGMFGGVISTYPTDVNKYVTLTSTSLGDLYMNAVGQSIRIGSGSASSTGNSAIAMGYDARAKGDVSLSIGYQSRANGNYSTAIGTNSEATANEASSFGYLSKASGEFGTAVGYQSNANGTYSTAIGNDALALGVNSLASGISTRAYGLDSSAIGYGANALKDYSTAIGDSASANESATAIGSGAIAWGNNSLALGTFARSYGFNSIVLGSALANLDNQIILASDTKQLDISGGYADFENNSVYLRDNKKIYFGDAKDSSIYYNGANLLINPKEVGSGEVNVSGQLRAGSVHIGQDISSFSNFEFTVNSTSGGMIFNRDSATLEAFVLVKNNLATSGGQIRGNAIGDGLRFENGGASIEWMNLSVNGSDYVQGKGLNHLTLRGGGTTASTGTGSQIKFTYNTGINYAHGITTTHDSGSAINNQMRFWLWNYGTDANNVNLGTKNVLTLVGNGNVGINNGNPTYPLTVSGNVSTISIWSDGNVSATGYITRTSNYDKSIYGNALQYAKDSDEYYKKDALGKSTSSINHSALFGYTTWEETDLSKPVNRTKIEETCTTNNEKQISECHNENVTYIDYPFNRIVEGDSLDAEINLLKQQVFELKTENDLIKLELCKKDMSYVWCK